MTESRSGVPEAVEAGMAKAPSAPEEAEAGVASVRSGVLRVLAAGGPAGRERLELLDRRGRGGIAAEIRQTAAEIVDCVRAGGDAALLEAVARFDGYQAETADSATVERAARWVRGSSDPLPPEAAEVRTARKAGAALVAGLRPAALSSGLGRSAAPPVSGSEDPRTQRAARSMEARSATALRLTGGGDAGDEVAPSVLAAIDRARDAIETWHRALLRGSGVERVERDGVTIEERRIAIRRVGLYVPGGRFPYPSTVLMTAIPARLAGVEEIVVATPPRAYLESPVLRHVLDLAGVDEVWGMGGAHAVAALAYGTESIRPVDLIAGPGNAWVAAAKQHVASDVGVDRDAGPSEVVVVATAGAPAECVAADLLAQAEHDPLAVAVLVTDSADLAARVAAEVDRQLAGLPTAETAAAALDRHGAAFVAADLDEALALAERIAPEHLQLIGGAAEARAGELRNAGAVFVGASSPVAFGDYVAGPSHVLPTGGSARFSSGLGTDDFLRRSHTVRFSDEAAAAWAGAVETLATTEGLAAHAAAARLRRESGDREAAP